MVNDIHPDDIDSVDRYQAIDWSSATIISTSLTHGIVLAPDRQTRGNVRVGLIGCSGTYPRMPRLKAHNSFSRAELKEILSALSTYVAGGGQS